MSLAPLSPLITNWIEKGLKWKYVWNPNYRPITIAGNSQIGLPVDGFTYKYPEGVLLTFGAMFDHPLAGIRMENAELDTGESFTPFRMNSLGTVNQPWFVYGMMPPSTLHGRYMVLNYREWAWKDWTRLYLINTDSTSHRCLVFAYTMAVLMEPRTEDPLLLFEKLKLSLELNPPCEASVRNRLADELEKWSKEIPKKLLVEEEKD